MTDDSNSTKARAALLDAAAAHHEELMDAARRISDLPGQALEMKPADLEQMVQGFVAVVREAAEGASTTIRAQFVETIYPSFIAAGDDAHRLLKVSTTFHVEAACVLTRAVAPELRRAATEFMSDFLGGYTADIARVLAGASR